jgi:hypothetical protein
VAADHRLRLACHTEPADQSAPTLDDPESPAHPDLIITRFIADVVLPHMGYAGGTALYWVLVVFSLLMRDVLVNVLALRPWPRVNTKQPF